MYDCLTDIMFKLALYMVGLDMEDNGGTMWNPIFLLNSYFPAITGIAAALPKVNINRN